MTENSSPLWRRSLAAVAVATLIGTAAACGGGSESDMSTADAEAAGMVEPAARAADGAVGAMGGAREAAPDKAPGVNRTVFEVRAVIRTGEVSLTSPDLGEARDDLVVAGASATTQKAGA